MAATADGAPWVLKPQREGGGNNLYGKELSAFLQEHAGKSELSGVWDVCVGVCVMCVMCV